MSRTALLALSLVALLGAVAASGIAHVRSLHRGREDRASLALQRRVESFEEHARFLARQSPDDIARFLRDFRGVSRVRLATLDGHVTAQFERVGYLVANLPANRLPPRLADVAGMVSGLETDRTRDDVHPDLRRVFRHTVERDDGLLELDASILVERESQKKIVIGKQGGLLKEIGSAARIELEEFLERRVYLRLWVKVREGWRDDRTALRELGID